MIAYNPLCRFISLKEIELSSLNQAHIMAVEAVCLIEEAFPRSILKSQLHLVVHLVDEIAIYGVVHSSWMFNSWALLEYFEAFCATKSTSRGKHERGLVSAI